MKTLLMAAIAAALIVGFTPAADSNGNGAFKRAEMIAAHKAEPVKTR